MRVELLQFVHFYDTNFRIMSEGLEFLFEANDLLGKMASSSM